eukprot:symbB.v1.2.003978.t1/scaffold170.1/size288889/24
MDSPTLAEHPAPEHSLRLEESSMDLMTSMKYAGGAALTGGAASAANMVFGVSVIGLLVFQFARSTVGKYIPQKQPELVPSPLLCTAEAEEGACLGGRWNMERLCSSLFNFSGRARSLCVSLQEDEEGEETACGT